MNKKLWAAMFAALACWVLLAGCSKKENTNEEQDHLAELGSEAGASRDANRSRHRSQRERHCDVRRRGTEGGED